MIPLLTNSFRPPPCLFLRFLDFISYAFKWNWLIGKLSSSFVFTERLKNCYYSGRFRSSHQRCSETKVVLRNFAKLTGKHLCQSLFFNKVADRPATFTSERSLLFVLLLLEFEFFQVEINLYTSKYQVFIHLHGFHLNTLVALPKETAFSCLSPNHSFWVNLWNRSVSTHP